MFYYWSILERDALFRCETSTEMKEKICWKEQRFHDVTSISDSFPLWTVCKGEWANCSVDIVNVQRASRHCTSEWECALAQVNCHWTRAVVFFNQFGEWRRSHLQQTFFSYSTISTNCDNDLLSMFERNQRWCDELFTPLEQRLSKLEDFSREDLFLIATRWRESESLSPIDWLKISTIIRDLYRATIWHSRWWRSCKGNHSFARRLLQRSSSSLPTQLFVSNRHQLSFISSSFVLISVGVFQMQ